MRKAITTMVVLVAGALPVAAQEPEAVAERSVSCRAVDAERAFKVARAGYQNAHDRIHGTPYRAHPGTPKDKRIVAAPPERQLADLREARRVALVAMEDALADWAYAEGWRIVSDRRLRDARGRCGAAADA